MKRLIVTVDITVEVPNKTVDEDVSVALPAELEVYDMWHEERDCKVVCWTTTNVEAVETV